MAIKDIAKRVMTGFLTGRTPVAQLGEIEGEERRLRLERDQLAGRLPEETLAAMQGSADAAARRDHIKHEVAALDERLAELCEAAGAARRRIADELAAERRREAEARPREIARLRRERMALIEELTEKMHQAALAMQAARKNADDLVALLDDEAARRFLAFHAFSARVQSGFAREFAINPNAPLSAQNSIFGIASNHIGAKAHWTAAQHEQEGADDLMPYFAAEAEAVAAQERLALRGAKTLLAPLPGGCWTLVPVELAFGDRAAADAAAERLAARGRRMAVLSQGGGFVLAPARFAGEVA